MVTPSNNDSLFNLFDLPIIYDDHSTFVTSEDADPVSADGSNNSSSEEFEIDLSDEEGDSTWTESQKLALLNYVQKRNNSNLDFSKISKRLFGGTHDATSCHEMWKKLDNSKHSTIPKCQPGEEIGSRKWSIGELWSEDEVRTLLEANEEFSYLPVNEKLRAIHQVLPERSTHAIKAKLKSNPDPDNHIPRKLLWNEEEVAQLLTCYENNKEILRSDDRNEAIQKGLLELGITKTIHAIQTKLKELVPKVEKTKAMRSFNPNKYLVFEKTSEKKISSKIRWLPQDDEELLRLAEKYQNLSPLLKVSSIVQELKVKRSINSVQVRLSKLKEGSKKPNEKLKIVPDKELFPLIKV